MFYRDKVKKRIKSKYNGIDSKDKICLVINQLYKKFTISGFLLVSLGVLLSVSCASWDITNHLLNKPESFFTPSHAGLYIGVGMVIVGSVNVTHYNYNLIVKNGKDENYRKLDSNENRSTIHYTSLKYLPTRLVIIGMIALVTSGPFDYAWHSYFGLDGLLSPSHALLAIGMIMSSIGGLLGIIHRNNSRNGAWYLIIGIIPVWLTISGLAYMTSLPFSNTEFFKFNPDPNLAAVIATLCFPFIISFILFSLLKEITQKSSNNVRLLDTGYRSQQFGLMSATTAIFVVINLVTTILPNEHLISTIPYYILNILPFIAVDLMLSKVTVRFREQGRRRVAVQFIGAAILGSTFFMLTYPLITYTYNEVLSKQLVWPSLINSTYFGLTNQIYPIIIVPAMAAGILGMMASSRLFSDNYV
jgi:hypothetical protein